MLIDESGTLRSKRACSSTLMNCTPIFDMGSCHAEAGSSGSPLIAQITM